MITVRAAPMFWLMLAVYGSAAGAGSMHRSVIWGAVIGFSVLWHELGHAAASVAFGSEADIHLHGFGGETSSRRSGTFKTWQRVVVSASGCAAGLALAAVSVALSRHLPSEYLPPLIWANLYISLLNLLPIQPLDGGHLTVLVLQARFGLKGALAAHVIGAGTAVLAALWFFFSGQPFMAALGGFLAAGEVRAFRRTREYNPQDEDETLLREYQAAQEAWENRQRDAAVKRLVALKETLKAGLLRDAVTRQLAHFYYAMERHNESYALLKEVPRDRLTRPNRVLMQRLAHGAGDHQESVRLGQNNFQESPDPETAKLLAASYAALGDERRAAQWMGTAKRLSAR